MFFTPSVVSDLARPSSVSDGTVKLVLGQRGDLLCLMRTLSALAGCLTLACAPVGLAIDVASKPVAGSGGELAIKRMEVAPGLKVSLFADETQISHPVAFSVDEQGRFYVSESFRFIDPSGAWTDIRPHLDWLDEDLASRSLEDRRRMYVSRLGDRLPEWTKFSERVRLIEDRDGDGRADHDSVFAEGFNDLLDGTASGVFARKGNVWFTCIPNLWLLRDPAGTGRSTSRQSLLRGFGVHLGFLGHDLHGLCLGPDGKLYFSIGDRGTHIDKGPGRWVDVTETGAVFRSELDGSQLEVFATGLRNPQELAFDKFGNLWSCDNNADHGDGARWVYVVEGGDSGWRVGYQHLTYPVPLGPWTTEKLWYPAWKGQSAAIVPPVANLTQGPSGLAYYPGTGLGTNYENHFLVCDFKGEGGGIHSLSVRPKGASFELVDPAHFVWRIPATDVEFAPDGSVYACTWNGNINAQSKAYIYRITDPRVSGDPLVAETKRVIAEGMTGRNETQLTQWLGHPDLRVRREAQFELAERGAPSIAALERVLRQETNTIPRLHATWGLGQIAARLPQKQSRVLRSVVAALEDDDVEVQAQAAKVLGDCRYPEAFKPLSRLLAKSHSARVQFFAAQSLGKLGRKGAVEPLVALLRQNRDEDPLLRHAAVHAWASLGDPTGVKRFAGDASASVRMGALLVMRRRQMPELAAFLSDTDPLIVVETARAINDAPMNDLMPQLAALADVRNLPVTEETREALWRRIVNANLRLGGAANAKALAHVAARDLPDTVREEALLRLAEWARPSNRDALTGLWRPLRERDVSLAKIPAQDAVIHLSRDHAASVRVAALRLAGRYELQETAAPLRTMAADTSLDGVTRVEAFKALAQIKAASLLELAETLSRDSEESLRQEAEKCLAKLRPGDAVGRWARILENGTTGERQNALAELAKLDSAAAGGIIEEWMERLLSGKLPPELQLDVLEAAGRRPALKALVTRYNDGLDRKGVLAPYRETLTGGNAIAGRKIFPERADVSCVRCHKIGNDGGDVGPNLAGIGQRQPREYLLESLVAPNARIAPGFESLTLTMKDGTVHAGSVKQETAAELVLNSPEEGFLTLRQSDITDRQRGVSGMPEGFGQLLGKRDLRDLVEFLANVK